jgi:RNA polymerase sporulation-specific sigma factor
MGDNIIKRGKTMIINKVEICGINTSQLPKIKSSDMREMIRKIQEGDTAVRDQFIFGNLRLVLSVIQRFNSRNEPIDDLFQIGCVGLIKAIDNFDLSLDVKFSTYAVPMIIGEIRRYLRDNNSIRVSRSMKDTAYKALQVREKLTLQKSCEPTIDEIAKELNIDKEDVIFALESIQEPVSLFEPIYNDGGDALYIFDQIKDERNLDEKWVEKMTLEESINELTERERQIVDMRFYKGKTQMEVAEEIGISQAQVSRLEKSALSQIRKRFK